MTKKKITVNKECKIIPFNIFSCELDFKTICADTLLVIRREVRGLVGSEPEFEATFSEAVKGGWLSDDHHTMAFTVSLHDSELPNFYGSSELVWQPSANTYGVFEPMPNIC